MENYIIPKELSQKLTSQDVLIYAQGVADFINCKGFLIPKNTFDALEHDFIIPEDLKQDIFGYGIYEYIEAIKRLCDWGLVLERETGLRDDIWISEGFVEVDRDKFYDDHPTLHLAFEARSYNLASRGHRFEELENTKENKLHKKPFQVKKEKGLIKQNDLFSYVETVGIEGLKFICDSYSMSSSNLSFSSSTSISGDGKLSFCNALPINTANYLEISNIIGKRYDKRLDEVLKFLLRKFSSKFFFLPKELKATVLKYFEFVIRVKKVMSKEDVYFIRTFAQHTKRPSLLLFFKKKEIFEFLKENYSLYREGY